MSDALLTFIARQPILDASGEVHAYELLHRSGPTGGFSGIDASKATLDVMRAAFIAAPLDRLTDGRLAFINVPEELLVQDFISVIPAETAVIEVLETVRPSPRVVAALRALKARGHRIALDDFEGHASWEPLVALADYIKVDFMLTPPGERGKLLERWKRPGLRFLAEKVETREDQIEAVETGYDLFQGYYFCQPETRVRRELPRSRHAYVMLLQALSRKDLAMDEIEEIIHRELSLTAGLLRYMNSAVFGLREEITSIRQALVHLGERPLKRWGTLLAMTGLGGDQPVELLRVSLIRARFGELVAEAIADEKTSLHAFLAGLFSSVDALLGMSMEIAVEELGLATELRGAILGDDSTAAKSTRLARALEQGDWKASEEYALSIGMPYSQAESLYADAIAWGDEGLGLLR